jgi:hypothetical protein
MQKTIQWLKKEVIYLFPIIIYFMIVFNLTHFSQSLMLRPDDVQFTSYLGATLGAILAAKVIVIVDALPFMNAFVHQPLIYNITWKFFIYSFFVLLVQIMDYTLRHFYLTHHWNLTYLYLKTDLSLPLFWGVQIAVLMYFLIFIIFSELTRVIGASTIKQIFFG